jgi:hypothetical protein
MHDFSVEIDSEPSYGRIIRLGKGGCSAIRKAILLMVIALCVLQVGCRAVQTIWSAKARSPDGYWLATTKTEQHGGFGTAGIVTSVYLERTNGSYPPVEVLEFFHDPRDPSGTIDLAMKWATPSHLDVTYNGRASLDLQVVKCAGVEISLGVLSGERTNTPH